MKRRSTDLLSLGFGLFFLGVAGLSVTTRVVHIDLILVGFIVTCGVVALGVLGVVRTLLLSARRRADNPDR